MALEDLTGFNILFVTDGTANTGEAELVSALETAGATVTTIDDNTLDSGDDSGQDLCIISSRVSSLVVAGDTVTWTIPVITCEAFHWADDDLVSVEDFKTSQTQIAIVDDTHPIAVNASVSNGTITVYSFSDQVFHGSGTGDADVIAHDAVDDEPCLFVYEQGANLEGGGTAAGMRICAWVGQNWYQSLNATGEALFDACVNYALGLIDGTQQVTLGVLDATPVSDAAALEHTVELGGLDVTPASDNATLEAVTSLEDLTGLSILFVVADSGSPNAGEANIKTHLETAGATVDLLTASSSDTNSTDGYDLWIISATSSLGDILGNFTPSGVPGIHSQSFSWGSESLATSTGTSGPQNRINITDDTHPIAVDAGIASGIRFVYNANQDIGTVFGSEGAGAEIIGVTLGSSRTAFFAYRFAAELVTGLAQARIVCFFSDETWDLASDGLDLFDASVNWALKLIATPQQVLLDVLDATPVSDAAALEHTLALGALDVSPESQGAALEHTLVLGTLDATPTSQGASILEPSVVTGGVASPRGGRRYAAAGLTRRW